MEEAVTCGVCCELYEEGSHEPVVLTCGHTFCRACLTRLHKSACPACRTDISHVQVQDLPVSFSLLSVSSTYKGIQCMVCSEHGDDLRYWCRECGLPLCGLCLYSSHPHGHHVQLANACLQERRQALHKQIKHISNEIKERRGEIKSSFYESCSKIKVLCQRNTTLNDLENDLSSLSTEVKSATSIESILVTEAKLKSTQCEEILSLSSCNNVQQDSNCGPSGEFGASGGGKATVCGVSRDERTSVVKQKSISSHGQSSDINRAALEVREGKLLLHSLSQCVDNRLYLKVPSEVFLELSVGGRCLGRVYIQLWCQMRRAQQFMLLCHGILGASYVGASISRVQNFGKIKESILFCDYIDNSRNNCRTNIMADLEWGGQYEGSALKGVVMAVSFGPDESGFGICTRGQKGKKESFQCPFGKVYCGMDVVEAAVHHEPVSEVIIKNCGLVLPDMTLE